MKAKINLDTLQRVQKFVEICSRVSGKVHLIDGNGYCVNAKSILGAMATADWSEVYVESEQDIYTRIKDFVVLE